MSTALELSREDGSDVVICHGLASCLATMNERSGPCEWCYRIASHDLRSTEEVMADMERIRRGH